MTKVILKRLVFSNMFSYGENNVLELDKQRIVQLSAINGQGKTSLALIIQELLFNKNIKGIKKGDIANRYSTSKNWDGQLHFTVDSNEYTLSVTRSGASTKVKLLENNIDISEHKVLDTYKKIQDILNLDFSVFSQLTYQSSTDLLDFLKATDTNRKKFLISLFNLERYLEIGDKIKLLAGEIDRDVIALQGELRSVSSFLEQTTIPDIQQEKPVPVIDEELYNQQANIKIQIASLHDTCKRIDKNNLYIKEQQQLKFDAGMREPEAFTEQEKLQTLKTKISVLTNEANQLNKQRSSIKINDTCPSCGQPIDNSHILKIKNDIDERLQSISAEQQQATQQYKTLEQQHSEYNKLLAAYNQNQQNISRFEQLLQLIDNTLPANYPNMHDLLQQQQEISQRIAEQEQELTRITKYNKQVSAHNAKVEALIEQKDEFLFRQSTLKTDIIDKSSRLAHLNILKKAFSTSGIVAFKLENLTKELESTINYYLSLLSDGQFQVEFTLDKEKLNISVINNGLATPIETVSGGEFSRIQTSILLAIRNLLSKLGGSSINLLFLDEITGVLDEEGKEKLVEVLQREDDLNVFIISHDFTHPLIDKINIVKEKNISYIQR